MAGVNTNNVKYLAEAIKGVLEWGIRNNWFLVTFY